MAFGRHSARRLIGRAVTRLPDNVLARLESDILLARGKGWGAHTVDVEVQACQRLLGLDASEPIVAFDVGANCGNWTGALLSTFPHAEVVAFEPSAEAFALLHGQFSSSNHVTIVKAAVGSVAGHATLYADRPGSGLASLTLRQLDHLDIDFSHSEPVEVITLDEWCSANGVAPQLLKLDVEGHELDVLQGASNVLESVLVVQFEFGGCHLDTRKYFRDFFAFFSGEGFTLYRLGPRRLSLVDSYRESDEVFLTTNFFASRQPLAARPSPHHSRT